MPLKSINTGVTVITSGMNSVQDLLYVIFYYRRAFSTEINLFINIRKARKWGGQESEYEGAACF